MRLAVRWCFLMPIFDVKSIKDLTRDDSFIIFRMRQVTAAVLYIKLEVCDECHTMGSLPGNAHTA